MPPVDDGARTGLSAEATQYGARGQAWRRGCRSDNAPFTPPNAVLPTQVSSRRRAPAPSARTPPAALTLWSAVRGSVRITIAAFAPAPVRSATPLARRAAPTRHCVVCLAVTDRLDMRVVVVVNPIRAEAALTPA